MSDTPDAQIEPESIFLVDASGYIFRAYHALPKLSTRKGEPTGAVYGFTQMLIKLEQDYHPTWLGVVFDKAGTGSFRDQLFLEYKANRAEAPDDLRPQFKRVRDVTEVMNLSVLELEGWEADDIIATLSRRARERGLRVVIVSSDKDLMQLVGDGVRMVRPIMAMGQMKDSLVGEAEVKERYGVPPSQLGDVLALMGDSVDNVPGVHGIGEKTATLLIQHFGSLANLLSRLDEVPSVPKLRGAAKVKAALVEHRAEAELSRKLVQLEDNVPLELDLEGLRRRAPDMAKVEVLFQELEFGRLLDRLRPKPVAAPASGPTATATVTATGTPTATAAATATGKGTAPAEEVTAPPSMVAEGVKIAVGDKAVRIIGTVEELAALVEECKRIGEVGIGLETTGSALNAVLCGVALAAEGMAPAYVPLGHRYIGMPQQVAMAEALVLLEPLFADEKIKKHVHGHKDALLICTALGIQLRGIVGDSQLAAYVIDPNKEHELSGLAASLGAAAGLVEERGALLGSGKKSTTYDSLEVQRAATFAGRRAEAALAVSRVLGDELSARAMRGLLDDMELPLARVLAVIERHGVRLDTQHLKALGNKLGERLTELEAEVRELVGYEVNLGSPKQLQELLFEKLQLPATKKTKTGFSTDAEVLEELAPLSPIAAKVLEHRQLSKLKGTYIDALPQLVDARTGRLHTSYHQTVAATGRLSSSDPNLQNIPIRSEIGKEIRRAFIADPGHLLIAADYSQIELRVLAHLSQDPVLVDAFERGEDIHTRTAREVFGVEDALVSPEMRRVAKAINYGLAYGQTDFGLAQALRIPREEARKYIQIHMARYAGIASFLDGLVHVAQREKGARTLLGRFRPLPELESRNRQVRQYGERMARNTPIQGTAADILKQSMIAVQRLLDEEAPRVRMLLTVHDELVLEAPEADAEAVAEKVRAAMVAVWPHRPSLVVDVGIGRTWADC